MSPSEATKISRRARWADAPGAQGNWLGPPLVALLGADFEQACARLMRRVEADYTPALIIGVRTGGLIVAEAMARGAAKAVPVLPLSCRRASTNAKARLPLLRAVLGILPRPVVDLLRRMEHRYVTVARARRPRAQQIDHAEALAIARFVARLPQSAAVLVADDAVDSGITLATVLRVMGELCPPGTELRTAAITQTLERPAVRPDYVLFHGMLCRFPWSFDVAN